MLDIDGIKIDWYLAIFIIIIKRGHVLRASLYYYRFDHPLDESYVGVLARLLCCPDRLIQTIELRLGLLEHLSLLRCYTASLNFLLLSDSGFVLLNLSSATLAAPALALAWTEVISPGMTLRAVDLNNCTSLLTINLEHDNLNSSTVSMRLTPHGINYFYAIMANLVLTVCELPEGDLTSVACFFLSHIHR